MTGYTTYNAYCNYTWGNATSAGYGYSTGMPSFNASYTYYQTAPIFELTAEQKQVLDGWDKNCND